MLLRLSRAVRQLRNRHPTMLGAPEAYARWAEVYPAEAHNPFMRLEQKAMLALLPDVAGKTALDVGCGSGRYLEILRARGARLAVGIDLSFEMLRKGRAPREIARADLRALPLRGACFDVVTSALAVGHVIELGAALVEMSRALVSGGTLVYSDFHPFAGTAGRQRTFSVGGQQYAVEHHIHLYSAHHAACRAAGLEIEEVSEALSSTVPPFPAVLAIRARRR